MKEARGAITDARFLEMARADYRRLREEHPEFAIPPHDDLPETRFLQVILSLEMYDVEDVELRREAASGAE